MARLARVLRTGAAKGGSAGNGIPSSPSTEVGSESYWTVEVRLVLRFVAAAAVASSIAAFGANTTACVENPRVGRTTLSSVRLISNSADRTFCSVCALRWLRVEKVECVC